MFPRVVIRLTGWCGKVWVRALDFCTSAHKSRLIVTKVLDSGRGSAAPQSPPVIPSVEIRGTGKTFPLVLR